MTRERKNFQESKEGYTYMQLKSEERITQRLMGIFMSTTKDLNKWSIDIKRITKKIKLNASDDFDTDYVDIDQLMQLYMENFKQTKAEQQRNIFKKLSRKLSEKDNRTDLTIDLVKSVLEQRNDVARYSSPLVQYAGEIA